MSKISIDKFTHTFHMLCVHKVVSRIIDLSFGLRKKRQILVLKTSHFMVYILSCLHRPRVMSFFRETLPTNMDYGDVYVKFFI
jgi:hypothetical protein